MNKTRTLLIVLFLISSFFAGYMHKPVFLMITALLFITIIVLTTKIIINKKKTENALSFKYFSTAIFGIVFLLGSAVFIRDLAFVIKNSDKCPHDGVFTNQKEKTRLNNSFDFENYIKELSESSLPFKRVADSLKYENKYYPFFTISSICESPKQKILIIASVHGDEPAGALSIPKLLKEITLNGKKYENTDFLILCPMNPVGLAFVSRENECGCNINRDYESIKQPQTKHIINSIKDFKPTVIIDLHENHGSWPTCIMANDIVTDVYGKSLCNYLTNKNTELASEAFDNSNLEIKGWHKFTAYRKLIRSIIGVDDLFWYSETLNVPLLTLECDQSLALNKRISICLDVIEHVNNNPKN